MATAALIGGLLPTVIGGVGSYFAGRGSSATRSQETPIQARQRELIDDLLASVKGEGQYSDLFNMDEEAFQKSYVEPSMARFRNQIAPQIQQQYLAGGQQRGTGLEDTLSRAGVDLDQMLNQQYASMQQQAQERKLGALGRILGQGAGARLPISPNESGLESLLGFLSSDSAGSQFGNMGSNIGDLLSSITQSRNNSLTDTIKPLRKGFEREDQVYNPYTGVQE